jgi:hypothetical protein
MSTEFNASVSVTELLTNTLESKVRELTIKCIRESAQRHGFNADEEIALLGLENVSIQKKTTKKPVPEKQNDVSSSKKTTKKEKVSKVVFPLPFIKEYVNVDCCQGLVFNRGLFTQCLKNRLENGLFCNSCLTEANKNEFKQPNCGTVETRLASELYEFKDPNGRSPISYILFLNKLNLSINTAVEEATKINITIPIEHFDIIKTDKKSKGRPKKIISNLETKSVDLFSKLSDDTEFDIIEDNEEEKEEKEEKEVKVVEAKVVKAKLSDEEKEIKKAQLEEERAKKKAEREQKLAQEKALKKEAEQAAKVLEKKEKEAKVLEKKEKEAKVLEQATKVLEQATKVLEQECNNFEAPQQKEEATTKVTVSKIQICGKKYLKSSVNILYDPDTKEEIGIWDPETNTIKDLPDDDEEEEDSYDTDDDN